jgi:hypothetical protein
VDSPGQRKLFIDRLRVFFLNEYDITGEAGRSNWKVTARVAKGVGILLDEEGVLIDHLEYVVNGLMSKNRILWKNYFVEQVKQRRKLLVAVPPGSKMFDDKVKVLIEQIRWILDASNFNR